MIEQSAWIVLALLGPAPVQPEAEATGPGSALAGESAEPVARVASVVIDVIGPGEAAGGASGGGPASR